MSIVMTHDTVICTTCNSSEYLQEDYEDELYCSKCTAPANTPTLGPNHRVNPYNLSDIDFTNYTKDLEDMYLPEYNQWIESIEKTYP